MALAEYRNLNFLTLNNGKIVLSTDNYKIKFFNEEDLSEIKELEISLIKPVINGLFTLSDGTLIIISDPLLLIKINAKDNTYDILQSIRNFRFRKIIEIPELNELFILDLDNINIYMKEINNFKYFNQLIISFKKCCLNSLLRVNHNEIVISSYNKLTFYNIFSKDMKGEIENISNLDFNETLCMISDKCLAVSGWDEISIINIESKTKIRSIFIKMVTCFYKINSQFVLTGEKYGDIKKFEIFENDLILNETNFENYNEGINNFVCIKGKFYTGVKDQILEIKKINY